MRVRLKQPGIIGNRRIDLSAGIDRVKRIPVKGEKKENIAIFLGGRNGKGIIEMTRREAELLCTSASILLVEREISDEERRKSKKEIPVKREKKKRK